MWRVCVWVTLLPTMVEPGGKEVSEPLAVKAVEGGWRSSRVAGRTQTARAKGRNSESMRHVGS